MFAKTDRALVCQASYLHRMNITPYWFFLPAARCTLYNAREAVTAECRRIQYRPLNRHGWTSYGVTLWVS